MRSALHKLVRALPEPLTSLREPRRPPGRSWSIPSGWDRHRGEPRRPDRLDDLEAAVIDGECLHLGYRACSGEVTERVVHPGARSQGPPSGTWSPGPRRGCAPSADRVERAERTGEPVVRPDGFDLSEAWARIVSDVDQLRTRSEALGTAVPEALPCAWSSDAGSRSSAAGPPGPTRRFRTRSAARRTARSASASSRQRAGTGQRPGGFGSWVRIEEPASSASCSATSVPNSAPSTGGPAWQQKSPQDLPGKLSHIRSCFPTLVWQARSTIPDREAPPCRSPLPSRPLPAGPLLGGPAGPFLGLLDGLLSARRRVRRSRRCVSSATTPASTSTPISRGSSWDVEVSAADARGALVSLSAVRHLDGGEQRSAGPPTSTTSTPTPVTASLADGVLTVSAATRRARSPAPSR